MILLVVISSILLIKPKKNIQAASSQKCDVSDFSKWQTFNNKDGVYSMKIPHCWKELGASSVNSDRKFGNTSKSQNDITLPLLRAGYDDYRENEKIFSAAESKSYLINGNKVIRTIYSFDLKKCENEYGKYKNSDKKTFKDLYEFICGAKSTYRNSILIRLTLKNDFITSKNALATGISLVLQHNKSDKIDYKKIIDNIASTIAFDCLANIDLDLTKLNPSAYEAYNIGKVKSQSPDKMHILRILLGDYNEKLKNSNRQWFYLTNIKNRKDDRQFYFEGEAAPKNHETVFLRTTFNWIDKENIVIYQHNMGNSRKGMTVWHFNINNYSKKKLYTTDNLCNGKYFKFIYDNKELRYIMKNGDVVGINVVSGHSKVLMNIPNFNKCREIILWSNSGNQILFSHIPDNAKSYKVYLDVVDLKNKKIKDINNNKKPTLHDTIHGDIDGWSPSDKKIKFADGRLVYDIKESKKIDLSSIFKKLNINEPAKWRDDNTMTVKTPKGNYVINVNNLKYEKR